MTLFARSLVWTKLFLVQRLGRRHRKKDVSREKSSHTATLSNAISRLCLAEKVK